MATTNTDRNDLFALLALQTDFVSRDALQSAIHVCDIDPSRSIVTILVEQGLLTPSRASLIESLVEEHLRVHSNPSNREPITLPDTSQASTKFRSKLNQLLGTEPPPSSTDPDAADDPYATVNDLDAVTGQDEPEVPGLEPTEVDPDLALATRYDHEYLSEATDVGETSEGWNASADGSPLNTLGPPRTGPTASHLSSQSIRYTILKHHARGGLGDVYIARDEELNREVALKELQIKHADRDESRLRFMGEAEITGRLEHPGIVPVYGVGRYSDGRPYYAMRFVEGHTLLEAIGIFFQHKTDSSSAPEKRILAFRSLVGCFVDVCNTIGFAHSRGVVHWDIQPGKIKLGKFGETLIVDWGSAKFVNQSPIGFDTARKPARDSFDAVSNPNMNDLSVATLQYMSPEQASGKIDELGPASDIYSLGATLYSILTGVSAFPDPSPERVRHQVQHGKFQAPREVNRWVPAALEAICLKAMALMPEDRYPTTRELSRDIELWLADEPVSVYREPIAKRISRWTRRQRLGSRLC